MYIKACRMVHSHLDVKSVLTENLGSILGGTQCQMGDSLTLSEFS
jgi:hypothetical protein